MLRTHYRSISSCTARFRSRCSALLLRTLLSPPPPLLPPLGLLFCLLIEREREKGERERDRGRKREKEKEHVFFVFVVYPDETDGKRSDKKQNAIGRKKLSELPDLTWLLVLRFFHERLVRWGKNGASCGVIECNSPCGWKGGMGSPSVV